MSQCRTRSKATMPTVRTDNCRGLLVTTAYVTPICCCRETATMNSLGSSSFIASFCIPGMPFIPSMHCVFFGRHGHAFGVSLLLPMVVLSRSAFLFHGHEVHRTNGALCIRVLSFNGRVHRAGVIIHVGRLGIRTGLLTRNRW